MPLLPRSTGYLFLLLFTVTVALDAAGTVTALCAVQAVLLVLAQRRSATRRWVLPVQVALTVTAAVTVDGSGRLGCLLAATALWCLPNRLRWIGFGLVAAGSCLIDQGPHAAALDYLAATVATAAIGLVMYSLLRLPALLDRLDATREDLAQATLARERLHTARTVRATLGDELAGVMALLRGARTELERQPARARATMDEAARTTRRMIDVVRATADVHAELEVLPEDSEPISRLVPRLTLIALVTSLLAWTATMTIQADDHRIEIALGGAAMSGLLLAQLNRPRYATPLLIIQAAVALLPLPWLGADWCVWLILLAAAVLLHPHGRWGPIVVAGLIALRAVYYSPSTPVNGRIGWVVLALEATTVLFGLARFLQLSEQINRSRMELVRMTVQVERLRMARDIHDLLGLTLSVLALKSDLITELVTRDPQRAASELAEALRIAETARTDARAMVEDRTESTLPRELRDAARVLTATGAHVDLRQDDAPAAAAARVLAPVVREAVTNILRHSTATSIAIHCEQRDGLLRLSIRNDGVHRIAASDSGGRGLRNMRTRVAEAGGEFSTRLANGEFLLTAAVPTGAECTSPILDSAHATGAADTTGGPAPM